MKRLTEPVFYRCHDLVRRVFLDEMSGIAQLDQRVIREHLAQAFGGSSEWEGEVFSAPYQQSRAVSR